MYDNQREMKFDDTESIGLDAYLSSINYVHRGKSMPISDEEFCVGIQTRYDVFTFLLDGSSRLVSDDHLLYHGSRLRIGEHLGEDEKTDERNYHAISPDGAVTGPFEKEAHGAYHSYESKRAYVHLGKLSKEVASIVFCIAEPDGRDWWPPADRLLHARLFKNADWLFGGSLGDTIACTDFIEGFACLANLDGPVSQIEELKDKVIRDDLLVKNEMYAFGAAEILSLVRTEDGWIMNSLGKPYHSIEEIIEKYNR